MNVISQDPKFSTEVVEYLFPNKGREYIRSQLERYVKAYKEGSSYLNDNEQIVTSRLDGRMKFIVKLNQYQKYEALYRLDSVDGLDSFDMNVIKDPTKPVIVTIFHHVDLDGNCSGAVASKVFERDFDGNSKKKLNYVSYNYAGKRIANACDSLNGWNNRSTHKIAIIVDLNLKEDEISKILHAYNTILWIDHHDRSIKTALNVSVSSSKKFYCLIDTRYSAAYLCYLLFQQIAKSSSGLSLNCTCPAIVSMFDTRMLLENVADYASIVLTEELFYCSQGKKYKLHPGSNPLILTINDRHLIGRKIFLKNNSKSKTKMPVGYDYGISLNQYFNDMTGFEPYSPIWDKILVDEEVLEKMIQTGKNLRQITYEKMNLLSAEEVKYNARYNGMNIVGIIGANSAKFLAEPRLPQSARMVLRYNGDDGVSVSIYTDDVYLKQANLGTICGDIFKNNNNGGGHPGAAAMGLNIHFVNSTLTSIKRNEKTSLSSAIPNLNTIYNNTKWSVDPGKTHPRYDQILMNVFKIISIVVFSKWDDAIQKSFKKVNS